MTNDCDVIGERDSRTSRECGVIVDCCFVIISIEQTLIVSMAVLMLRRACVVN